MGKQQAPDLEVVADFGGSGTKFVYARPGEAPAATFMEPDVALADRDRLAQLTEGRFAAGEPEDRAWIELDDGCYAVGRLAATQCRSHEGLKQSKQERAALKLLAGVWVLAQRLGLKKRFKLSVVLLLPIDEVADATSVGNRLTQALQAFNTPTGTHRVNLVSCNCCPEGTGIYLAQSAKYRKRSTVAVVLTRKPYS